MSDCQWCPGKDDDGEPRETHEFGIDLVSGTCRDRQIIRMATITLCLACEIKLVDRVWPTWIELCEARDET